MSTRSGRRYWRNMALVIGLALLIVTIIILGLLIGLTVRYANASLHPPRIVLAQTPRAVGIDDYEDVSFTSDDGIELRGWYVPSQNGAAIILAHGYAGNRETLLPEARILAGQDYGVLLFDFRGHGESGDALVTIGDHERRDLRAAIDFVAARPDVDPDRIGALGFSMGAATIVQVAAEDDRLRAVIIEAAFGSLEETIRYRARLLGPLSQIPSVWAVKRAGVTLADIRPVDDLCAISPRPLLLIYGEDDTAIPPGTQQAMFDAACDPVERWLIPKAVHQNYTEVVPEEYESRLVAFFARTLADKEPHQYWRLKFIGVDYAAPYSWYPSRHSDCQRSSAEHQFLHGCLGAAAGQAHGEFRRSWYLSPVFWR